VPGFDGTGPKGQGAWTGGGWGRFAPLLDETGVPRGVGRGGLPWSGGRGRCWGGGRWAEVARGWWPAPSVAAAPDTSKGEGSEPEK